MEKKVEDKKVDGKKPDDSKPDEKSVNQRRATLDFDKMKKGTPRRKSVVGDGRPRLKPRTRFRAAVRKVIVNAAWLIDIDESELTDSARLNLIMLKTRKKTKKSLFSLQEKAILMKPASERTEAEKKSLNVIIRGLKCFRRYPEEVQKKLAAATYFVFYNANRVVVRQGQPASALYFILDGDVTVSQTSYDPILHQMVTKDVGTMGPGDMFGEVSLLHNIPRTATITTASTVELLCLWREDFETVLKASLQKQWDECKTAMQMFPYFRGWNDVAVRECCILSKMKTVEPDKIILGKGIGQGNFVHFVLEGECKIIEVLKVAVKRVKGLTFFRRYKDETELRPQEKLESHFMQVCLIRKGGCFCLGEHLSGRTVVSVTQVTLLQCPRYWIMQNNKADIWTRIKRYLDTAIPSSKQLYEDFVENRKWLRYKKNLVDDILANSHLTNNTTIYDVPYSIRLKENTLYDRPGFVDKKDWILNKRAKTAEAQDKLSTSFYDDKADYEFSKN